MGYNKLTPEEERVIIRKGTERTLQENALKIKKAAPISNAPLGHVFKGERFTTKNSAIVLTLFQ